jgi:hypothetical protein
MYEINSQIDIPDHDFLENALTVCMKERGLRLSNEIFKLKKELELNTDAMAKHILAQYGITNVNSPKQVLSYMMSNYNNEKLSVCTNERTGKLSSSKENMSLLAERGDTFALDLLKYRKYSKQLEYINSLLGCSDRFGRVFPDVSFGATNRVNYSNPPIMNIPKEILWNVLRPYIDGNYLFSIDIKNQEPCVLINWLGIDSLKSKLTSENGLYFEIYREIFGKEPISAELKELKTSWNALSYGSNLFGITPYCRNIDANKVYEYFTGIKELKNYRGKAYGLASNKVRRCSTYFGTELYPDARQQGQLQRQLMDFPVQGTCSDILALLVKRFYDYLTKHDLSEKLSLYYTRHDELIIEVDGVFFSEKGEESVKCLIGEILNHKVDDWTPFKTTITLVKSVNLQEVKEE